MKTFRICATQTVCYFQDIEANSLEEALKLADESDYDSWKEFEYSNWEVREDWASEDYREIA